MKTAIIDYEICNMFSVKHACEKVGISAIITSSIDEIMNSDLVILPGVGAFGDAIASLKRLDLIEPLNDLVAQNKPLIGICLGMQLLMSESCEFGQQKGLNFIGGEVKKFESPIDLKTNKKLKVPHMGWNKIIKSRNLENSHNPWQDTPLQDIPNEEDVYFVHSYYVEPLDKTVVIAETEYGNYKFCSAIHKKNIFAFQFHPERSGLVGIQIYKNLQNLSTALKKGLTNEPKPYG